MSAVTKNHGGPAFPVDTRSSGDVDTGELGHQTSPSTWQFPGMTLRDHFATQAMGMKFGKAGSAINLSEMAAKCYAMADAMLSERAK